MNTQKEIDQVSEMLADLGLSQELTAFSANKDLEDAKAFMCEWYSESEGAQSIQDLRNGNFEVV